MEYRMVTGLDLPAGENVWKVTMSDGEVFYHRSRVEQMKDDPANPHLQRSVKVQVWCCDETGQTIEDRCGNPKALSVKTVGLNKQKLAKKEITSEREVGKIIREMTEHSRAICECEDGFLSNLPMAE